MTFDTVLGVLSLALSFALFAVDKRKRTFWYFLVALLVLSTAGLAVRQCGHYAKIAQLSARIDDTVREAPQSGEDIYESFSHEADWESFSEALSRSEEMGKVTVASMDFQTVDHRFVKVRLYSRSRPSNTLASRASERDGQ
jgi:hypothetical protein